MKDQYSAEQIWLPVIGRALAQICLHSAAMDTKTMGEKAVFLAGLGLEIDDSAMMLDSTSGSVRELLRLARIKTKKRSRMKNGARKKKA